jgi:hypothetical protein
MTRPLIEGVVDDEKIKALDALLFIDFNGPDTYPLGNL